MQNVTTFLIPPPGTPCSPYENNFFLEKILGRMKKIDIAINTYRIVSKVVSTLVSKMIMTFYIFLTKKQKFITGLN